MSLPVVLMIVVGACFSFAPVPERVPERAPQETAQARRYFIAIFSRGPAWDEKKQAIEQTGFKEHGENLRRLRAEKKIPIGGRYGDKGMVIVEAKDEAEARMLFASDEMLVKKTFTLELHEFRPFYKGSIE